MFVHKVFFLFFVLPCPRFIDFAANIFNKTFMKKLQVPLFSPSSESDDFVVSRGTEPDSRRSHRVKSTARKLDQTFTIQGNMFL